MRSMNVLAAVLFASLASAGALVGCSSDDSNPATPPFDAGTVTVPEAAVETAAVSIIVTGSGYVTTEDGADVEGGYYVGQDVLCGVLPNGTKSTSCSAPQGSEFYGIPSQGWQWQGWFATVDGGLVLVSQDMDFVSNAQTPNPLTALFVPQSNGPDAAPPSSPDGG
jgi:hypothetical protein